MRSFKWLAVSLIAAPIFLSAGDLKDHKKTLVTVIPKIRAREGTIAELIHKKKVTTDQQQMSEILDQLVKEHAEVKKLYEEFEKVKSHIHYEHPEEGAEFERQYRPFRLKTLDEYEAEGGIDGKLTELKDKVRRKYGEPVSGRPEPPPTSTPVFKNKRDEQAEREKKRIKLSK